ncbi:TetR family transcriptional regulator [Mycolicibacterium madagascariense]|uniref:TetR family transcriptional regulator n=1 Tax=Mycolicibacterium madagascariense TaxID=212765 RepID=A0A7I7XD63_9MYCO|nr:TetR family transcriptional regulator [Mycolicibacterium madagascariense]
MPIAARRKNDAQARRRQLADVAIELLGTGGARGVSHPKVDVGAGVPAGTASFYFRTRRALLLGTAERLTELDLEDLQRLTELSSDAAGGFTGTAGFAELVMYSGTAPYLTRTRARYELILHAGRDEELMAALRSSVESFYRLIRDVVAGWHRGQGPVPDDVVDAQARATLALVNGVMLSFVAGRPLVQSAAELEHLLDGLIAGLAQPRT